MTDEGMGAPCDIEAERAVISAVISAATFATRDSAAVAARAYAAATAVGLTAGMFWKPDHETLWRAIGSMVDAGDPVDATALVNVLTRGGDLARIGGHAAVASFAVDAPAESSISYHARTVREYAVSRALVAAGARIQDLGWSTSSSAAVRASAALAEVEAAAATATYGQETTWATLAEIWPTLTAETKRRHDPTAPDDGIEWGYPSVDMECAPMRPGDLVVVTAYSGGGKSVLVANLAFDATQKQGKRALLHTLEMTKVEVAQRWASKLHRINLGRISRGQLHPEEQVMVEETHLLTHNSDALVVDDSAHLSLAQLRASIRAHKPDLVIVDQLPLMTPTDGRVNREQQMTALAYGLKQIAKDERVVMVVASQLNADAMKRKVTKPTLHDLRESKAIAHAANWVVALYEPDEDDDSVDLEAKKQGYAQINWMVLKARQGQNGAEIHMAKQYTYANLVDLGWTR
mgnify:CR=1 FL=1